jgi:arylsulfatase A-like enzyme
MTPPPKKPTARTRRRTSVTPPNILLIGIDSLLSTHMSCYGYRHLTTPHIDRFAGESVLFERTFSPNVPTTPGYGCMLTGRDIFSTCCVALRHQGPMAEDVPTLAEILKPFGYETVCVGFQGNPAARGFDKYLNFHAWASAANGPLRKAENLNEVTIPEIDRLAAGDAPFFLFLRHMDPHSPYLPPPPFDRMFYHGNECDPANDSMKPVMAFKPFCDYFRAWMPPGISDKDYEIAQYDGELAYMDACLRRIFTQLEVRGLLENTIVVINSDHGETLYDHECWFDHHGLYDNTLQVPLIIRYPARLPKGRRIAGYNQHMDLVPTLLDLAGLETGLHFDGRSLLELVEGRTPSFASSIYLTECTWMRKHGWRTPQWKLIRALEPDFHFKPAVELYHLVEDPDELVNLADRHPEVVAMLDHQMQDHIARRERETGRPNPIYHQPGWHGKPDIGAFESSQQAYDTLHIGDPDQARKLQAGAKK